MRYGYYGPEQADNINEKRLGAEIVLFQKITSTANAWVQLDYGQEDGLGSDGAKAKWYGAGVWLTYDLDPSMTVAFRGDYVVDHDGARTSGVLGFPATAGQRFDSGTATLNIKRWAHALVRPEIRYDRSSLF